MKETKDINGALSLAAVCQNFSSEYLPIKIANLFLHPLKMAGVVIGLKDHRDKGFLASRISMPSFMGIKNILDKEENSPSSPQSSFMVDDNNNIYNVVNTVFGFFENEPILGFCDQYVKDTKLLVGNIVFRKGDDLLCTEISLGDMLYLSLASNLPVYIRKEVMDNHGTEFENSIEIDAY